MKINIDKSTRPFFLFVYSCNLLRTIEFKVSTIKKLLEYEKQTKFSYIFTSKKYFNFLIE